MDKVIVVKLGGATLGSEKLNIEDIIYLQKQGKSLVVVHGGQNRINEFLSKQGIPGRFAQGPPVSPEATLEVLVAILAGLVNTEIVAAINDWGGRAVGISGVDGAFIQGKMGNIQLGYVGTVVKVDMTLIKVLLQSGYIPVIATIGLLSFDKPEKARLMLDINADIVAGEVAIAIGAERLIFLTDVVGVCDKSGELLPRLSPSEARALIGSRVASGGMIPKISACLRALDSVSTTRIIDGRQPHALLREFEGSGGGTTIE